MIRRPSASPHRLAGEPTSPPGSPTSPSSSPFPSNSSSNSPSNPASLPTVRRASSIQASSSAQLPSWSLPKLSGRLTEISGCSSLSLTVALVFQAQQKGEPTAWITCRNSTFFPPDVFDRGVDLQALPVIRVENASATARAANHLIRSGAFGLLILDLGTAVKVPMPLQSRLVGLAQKHDTAVVCITHKSDQASSLSSLISLRIRTWRDKIGEDQFSCGITVIKDKQCGLPWSYQETYRGPSGLR